METGEQPGDRLAGMDFANHNAEVKALWADFHAGKPTKRVPIILGTNARFFMLDAAANPERLDFQKYTEDPDAMFDARLRFARWSRFNLLQDAELGLPETWGVAPDFQNYYEAAWLGCPIEYLDGQVPDTRPAYADEPERLLERGMPGPFDGLMGKAREFHEHFRGRAAREEYLGRPIRVDPFLHNTDGPMTAACNLFGAEFTCTAMAAEPERLQRLFAFITEALILRAGAWRKLVGLPVPQDGYFFADDSVALISTAMYRAHILPHHQRICAALATEKPRAIHLCGDASRLFTTLRDELNVKTFDTGFPMDFAAVRRELGPEVTIWGGPHIELLRSARPQAVYEESKRILQSGVLAGGRFVLREGNNLAPGTPVENIEALYRAGREFGRLDG